MSSVLLAPHNDDETLFAAYTLMREKPHVVVCTRVGALKERSVRERETREAIHALTGSEAYEQWVFDSWAPDWSQLAQAIAALALEFEEVWAPAPLAEVNGRKPGRNPKPGFGVLQHDRIGELARDAFGPERTSQYCMYTRWHGRDQRGELVEPTGLEIARKLEALGKYVSQAEDESVRPWFYDRLDLREWVLP